MATRPDGRHGLRAEVAWGAAAALIALVLGAIALQLWNADLHVPFSYDGDANQNQLIVKGVLDHGWYQSNPDLGAPFGQKLYDFPVVSGDNLTILFMKGLGLFTSDSALVMNLFFLLTFPLTALTCFACGRAVGLTRPTSLAVAVLYALAPYHFIRGEYHLFIAAYYAVPLSAYLVVTAMAGRGLVPWRLGGVGRARLVRIGLLLLACAVIGSAHVYYAAFAIALLAVAALVRMALGEREPAAAAVAVAALIGVFVVANHLPNAIYRHQHGQNAAVERTAVESESYGLKLAAMFLPVEHHRLAPLDRLRQRYDSQAGDQLREGPPQALGLLPTLGVLGLLLTALSVLAGGRARRRGPPTLMLPLAAVTLAAILIGTVGGLSSVLAFIGSPQLRAWGRISIFIALFGLLALGFAVDLLGARRSARFATGLLAVLVLIGFLDQTTPRSAPAYASVKREYTSDAALVGQLEAKIGPGASVLQLPYEPFPEPQPAWVPPAGPYDLGRGYIHSRTLKWTYGAMKGRAGDWQWALAQLPPALVARAAAAAGFSAIYIDFDGYADRGRAVVEALAREIGARPTLSPDGRLAYFDLRSYRQRVPGDAAAAAALRGAVLRPIETVYGDGLSAARHDAQSRFYLAQSAATIVLRNAGARPRPMSWTAKLIPAFPAPATVTVTLPGGVRQRVQIPVEGKRVTYRITVPPGSATLTLRSHAHGQVLYPQVTRTYALRVEDPLFVDKAFDAFGPLPTDTRPAAYLSPFGRI